LVNEYFLLFFLGSLLFACILVIPKYIYLYSFYIIIIGDKKGYQYKLENLLKAIKLIIFLEFFFYFIEFFQNPELNYRESRYSVLLGNANEDGGLISTFYPILLYIYRDKRLKLFFLIIIYFFILYFMNGTRTSLVISVLITILHFLVFSKKKKIIFILVFLTSFLFYKDLSIFFQSKIGEDYVFSTEKYKGIIEGESKGNFSGRIAGIWVPTFKYITNNHLFFGMGNSSWNDVVGLTKLKFNGNRIKYRSPHNLFLVSYVDWGIIGLTLILILVITSIKYLLQSRKQKIAYSILLSWGGFLGWAFMANANSIFGWSVFILLIILSSIIKTNENIYNNPKLQLR